jgi:ABC-type lipoprotein release transport system permease subunit
LRGLLVVLAGFLGLIAAVGTLHYLALSVRRTRVPTAVLQALGFVRGQVRSVVSWQAATVAAIGVIVGTPLGLIVGRWVWRALVDDLGMIDDPVTPWLLVATVPFVFVGGALVLAAVPARRAARVRPAIALRGE